MFLRKGATFAAAGRATLSEKVGIEDPVAEPRLRKMYDDPRRDQRGWVMSALHVLALPVQALADASGDLLAVDEAGRLVDRRHLVFDHDDMLAAAVQRMRSHYEATPDPYRLVGNSFTLDRKSTLLNSRT